MMRLMIILLSMFVCEKAFAQTDSPKSFTIALHDERDRYIAEILSLALDKSGVPYELSTAGRIRINQERALEELNSPAFQLSQIVEVSGFT